MVEGSKMANNFLDKDFQDNKNMEERNYTLTPVANQRWIFIISFDIIYLWGSVREVNLI